MTAPSPLFRRVLIANRGEIAVRVAHTCHAMGIEPVAVHSDADATAPHVRAATHAVSLGGQTPAESYLRIDAVIEAALGAGCQAIHPGYGFLSENAAFARACEQAGLVFVGPRPDTIETMGSKTGARAVMEAAGVPTIPGYQGEDTSPDRLLAEAERIGYPLLVKAVFGGGGKGMRVVHAAGELLDAVGQAQREAEKAFGRKEVFLERFLERPRHIEVQVLGDGKGRAVHFGERECSIQRRHQKIIEECPSPSLTEAQRAAICETGRRAAEAVSYLSAGTVELIVDAKGRHYFLEMNTRLQVEHPVTELVMGVDLVEEQLRIAAGHALRWSQEDIRPRGHAIECRLYAEDPQAGFLPSTGVLVRYREPTGPGVRMDSGVEEGSEITPLYDPMLAKLVTWGADRAQATARMRYALEQLTVHGVTTNAAFLHEVISGEAFRDGDFHTRWVDDTFGEWSPRHADEWALVAALALAELGGGAPPGADTGGQAAAADPFATLTGWRGVRRGAGAGGAA